MLLRRLFLSLFALFCFAYPIAVIGVAFDVNPPFSLAWAGSALLFLEGVLLIVAAMLVYGLWRGLAAALIIIVLSYSIEALGVSTGFPFGAYSYTNILFPKLLFGVPLAVMFAWVLIVFGVYGWYWGIRPKKHRLRIGGALLAAALATLLDAEIEPVATHIEHYWLWLSPGPLNFYGVPLANFVAWFVVAFVLILLLDAVLAHTPLSPPTTQLAVLAPRILFASSLFMFGLVDLTHGYYAAVIVGLVAVLALYAVFASRRGVGG